MTGDLVVLGGYGATGRVVAAELAARFPGRVVVAGRDLGRAGELADSLGGAVRARQVDVERPADVLGVIRTARVVVMCVERANVAVARACLERGVHYVDISATRSVLAGIEGLHAIAREDGATAALSVGLAPGLTNLLARRCVQQLPDASGVDLTVLLGGAGDHGLDSVRWTVTQLGVRPPVGRRRRVDLPGAGRRTVHPFPFSDQHTLTAALGIPVTTRLCLDSRVLTTTVFALRAARLFAAARRLSATEALARALSRLRVGSDRWVVHAAATATDGGRRWLAAGGNGECAATAVIAAHVTALLDAGDAPPGVHHLDRLVDPGAFLDRLRADGIALHGADPVRP